MSQLERNISNQRECLLEQIFRVRETEIHDKYSCNSSCTANCHIFHQKHDWVRSHSDQFIKEFNSIRVNDENRCELRGETSDGLEEKKMHKQTILDVQKCTQSQAKLNKHSTNPHGD